MSGKVRNSSVLSWRIFLYCIVIVVYVLFYSLYLYGVYSLYLILSVNISLSDISLLILFSLNPSLHFVPAPRTRLFAHWSSPSLLPISFFSPFPNFSFRPSPSPLLYLPLCVILPATIGGCCESRGSSRFSFSPPPAWNVGHFQHLSSPSLRFRPFPLFPLR